MVLICSTVELDVAQDLELDLDEFCRLGRLGNFHQAKQFFRENLEQNMNDPYVFVQYAHMLLEMGDYKSIKALTIPYYLEKPENVLLQTNWKLIQSISTLRTEGLAGKNDMISTQDAAMAAASAVPRALQGAKHELPKRMEDQKDKWTEIEKRFVSKKAIEELGYEYEETVRKVFLYCSFPNNFRNLTSTFWKSLTKNQLRSLWT